MPAPTITAARVARHESLYPRLAALLKQVERVRPGEAVPEEVLGVERGLSAEARRVLGREGGVPALPKAALSYGGLAALCGQAVAALGAFEMRHSGHSTSLKCRVWRVAAAEPMPVSRLLPPDAAIVAVMTENPDADRARKGLAKLIVARYSAGYDQGYQDATQGKPMSSEYAERVWENQRRRQGKPY
jgi:hypothetical protein